MAKIIHGCQNTVLYPSSSRFENKFSCETLCSSLATKHRTQMARHICNCEFDFISCLMCRKIHVWPCTRNEICKIHRNTYTMLRGYVNTNENLRGITIFILIRIIYLIFHLSTGTKTTLKHFSHASNEFLFCDFLIVPIYIMNFILILPSNFSHIRCGHCYVEWILIFRRAHMWVLLHVYLIRKKQQNETAYGLIWRPPNYNVR